MLRVNPTPGVVFLWHALVSILVPGIILTGARFILSKQVAIDLPMWFLVITAVSGVPTITVITVVLQKRHQRRRAAELGARMVPRTEGKWIGNLDVLRNMRRDITLGSLGDGQVEWVKKLGPVMNFPFFWEDGIFTIEPDHIKTILATDFPNYPKGRRFDNSVASVLGTGVFNSDGDMWKFHRSMTRPFFSRDRVSDFENFERHSVTAIQCMKDRLRSGYAIDFQDLISRFTLDSASEFLFGKNVNSLADKLPYPHNASQQSAGNSETRQQSKAERFARAFNEAQWIISQRYRMGWVWPLTEIRADKTRKLMKVVHDYLEPIMQDVIEKHQSMLPSATSESKGDTEEVGDDVTLLDYLVQQTTDRTLLRDEILNIMIAGRDTTAAGLTFAVYLLSQHPDALKKLREEIAEKVGFGAGDRPTYEKVRDMKYLRAVLNETLRLFPPVPFDARETIHDTTWSSPDPLQKPLYIPAGASVIYSVFMMQRRKDLWGPDAEEFDPDRFLDERLKKYLVHNPYIFVPFNAGPRICLGQQFAYNEMSYMLIRILQNFSSITMEPDAQAPENRPPAEWVKFPGRKGFEKFKPKTHLTAYAVGGLWVKMQEASHASQGI